MCLVRSVMMYPLLICLGWNSSSQAQAPPSAGSEASQQPLSRGERAQVIDALVSRLRRSYVSPDLAERMIAEIRRRSRLGAYEAGTGARLAELLTADLRQISRDRHLSVTYGGSRRAEGPPSAEENAARRERMARFAASVNNGFEELDRLDGNVGYLRIDGFMPAQVGGDTAAASFTFLANTDALILDLRYSEAGGDPTMVALIISYLLEPTPRQLTGLSFRAAGRTSQLWTYPYISGTRYLHKPVFVLTSRETFSAGEQLAYDLKVLGRATLVGETTAGAANPGTIHRLSDQFSAFIPEGRALNPVTGTNWEGAGVAPDVAVPAEEGLRVAHAAALRQLLRSAIGEDRNQLESVLTRLEQLPRSATDE